jgi:hypothetical protein
MAKCSKCGKEYSTIHANTIRDKKLRETLQSKSECSRCDKRNNRRGFLKEKLKN